MQAVMVPFCLSTVAVLVLGPSLNKWIPLRLVLLLVSVACYAFISAYGLVVLLGLSIFIYTSALSVRRASKMIYHLKIFLALVPIVGYKIVTSEDLQADSAQSFISMIGISYFTFNGISYFVDVRRGYILPERSYGSLLLYLCYFPCLVAGPLHRYKYLSQEFERSIQTTSDDLSRGFRLIVWGLFKSVVLAARLKLIVSMILDHPESYRGWYVMLGGFAFFLQLYCDFSAYVDIAMGISRMLGIQLKPNFSNRVYLATSRTSFWTGWHQTLTSWFRDYVFFPLVKGKHSRGKREVVLLFTFALIGLWHDLSIRFLLWGLLNGLWVVGESKTLPWLSRVFNGKWRVLGCVYHLFFASFMAIIFRANNLAVSWQALRSNSQQQFVADGLHRGAIFVLLMFVLMDQINRLCGNDTIDNFLGKKPQWQRWLFYFGLALMSMSSGLVSDDGVYYQRF